MKKMAKRILSILCAAAIVLPMLAMQDFHLQAEAADGLDLTQMQIVTPASVVPVVRSAATELQTYVQKITGTKIPIVAEGSNSGAGIYIGKTNYAAEKGITYPTEGDEKGEAWAIQAVDGNLVLCGGSTRGVLYAVYHLLEDVLGVRWWNIWEEYVPTGRAIVPADYADSGVPAMEYREIYVGKYKLTDYRFYVRNRLNGNVYSETVPASYGGEESYGVAHVHTFGRYMTSSDLTAHPEWFSLVGSSRTTDQLCLTNAEMKAAFASRLVEKVAEDPDAIYAVSANDNENFCQCSSCVSAINTYGYSGYILNFVNEMAQAVTDAGYTDTPVEMLVYWTYLDAPKGGVTPKSNVMIRFADKYTDLLHSVNHSNNAQSMETLKAWVNICSNDIYYWQYVVNYKNNGVFPTMFHYGEDITTLQEIGVNGWFAEQEQCINTDFWEMKQWLMAKLMEEPVTGEEYAALMDDFLYGYYGAEAGKHVRDYLYYMHEKAEASSVNKYFGDEIVGVEWLGVRDIIKGNDYFEKAFAAAGSDETLLRRLRVARTGLDRAIVENYARWTSEASSAGLTLPFTQREVGERLYAAMTEQIALRGEYDETTLDDRYDCYSDEQPELPSGLDMDPGHYLEFTAEDMLAAGSAFSLVEDSDSLLGVAIRGDGAVDNSLILPYKPGRIPYYYHSLGYYNVATKEATAMHNIQAADIKADQGYQLYSFQWTVPSTVNDGDYLYMFGSWGLQNKSVSRQLQQFAGKTVTFYLNMKVTGDIYGTSSKPVYYIDRMIIVPYSQLTHSYATATDVYGTGCRSVCSVCGDVQVTEHSWDAGVTAKEPTYTADGEKLFTCSTCGSTRTEVIPKLENDIPEHTCTEYREGDFCSICGAKLYPSVHEVFNYNYKSFNNQEGAISDADAYDGHAIQYTVNLSAASIPLYRYESGNPEFQYEYMKLGTIAKADLKTDGAYHTYSITTTLPENGMKGNGNLVYFTDNWTISNTAMAKDLYTLAGKTVTIILSMKITGDDLSQATVCVDRMQITDSCRDYQVGNSCSKCGAEVVVDASAHAIFTYGAASFNGTQVSDANAYQGVAGKYTGVNFSVAAIPLYRYESGNPEFQYEYMKLGTIAKADLKTDGAYHTYSITTTLPENGMKGNGNLVYLTDSWTISNTPMAKDLYTLAGKTVTITISMKVEGDLGSATVYVDKMQILDSCQYHISANGTYCTVCGKSLLDESLPDELQLLDIRHINRYDTADINKKPEESFVSDSESPLGTAWTYEMNITNGLDLRWYASGVTDRSLLKIPYAELKKNDGYHFYKTTLTVWEDIPATGSYTYLDWHCLSSALCNDIGARAGKTVDIYLSVKVTGVYTNTAENKIMGNVYVDQMILVDHCEDNWDEGVVTQEPTADAEGVMTYTCTVCGATKTEPIAKRTPVTSWNLELDGNIGMNFVLNVTAEEAAAATVEVTVNGETVTKNVADLLADGKYVLSVDLAAAQMKDTVTVKLTKGDVVMTKSYSAREYADVILAGSEYTAEAKTLVKYMLAYGAASQTYFQYNDEDLADDGIEVTAAAVPTEGGVYAVSGSATGVKYYGSSLVYRNKIAVRIYFTGDVTGKTFTVNGTEVTPESKEDMYYIEVADICPQDLDQGITVAVDGLTVTYAPMDYIIRMYAKGGESAALVQALYGYYVAAEAYAG